MGSVLTKGFWAKLNYTPQVPPFSQPNT